MEKYRFVGEKKSNLDENYPNELTDQSIIWIKQQGKPRGYISYAMSLFEQGFVSIKLKAMGRAIHKAVTISEILKRKLQLCKF